MFFRTFICLLLITTATSASFRSFFSSTSSTKSPILSLQSQSNQGIIDSEAIAYPSPAINGETEIGFQITGGDVIVELYLYDQFGQELLHISKNVSAGYNTIPINSSVLGYSLPVGVYYYVLQIDSETVSKGNFGVVK